MPGKHNAGGCGCCGGCATCAELYAAYGYTNLAVSGVAGALTLYTGAVPPPVPHTWAGFSSSSLTIPNAQGGLCDDSIIQDVGMTTGSPPYYFSSGDPVKFWSTSSIKASLLASIVYSCDANVPGRGIGISVGYYVTGSVSTQFSESSFTDWTWSNFFGGRQATKTFANGSVATWSYSPSGSQVVLSGGITHIESDLEAGNPIIDTLTMPTFPYDYLGIMVGTVTIS